MTKTKSRRLTFALLSLFLVTILAAPPAWSADSPPTLPPGADVLLLGHPHFSGEGLGGRTATMAMGRADKSGPLALGATIQVGALQTTLFESATENGKRILRRTTTVSRPGNDAVLMKASIDMDASTLLPLVARTEQGGTETVIEYDWENFVVRTTGPQPAETVLDLPMVEVGAHDVWMAALPLREGYVGRIPAIFGATGTKYWAVPRVVGSEPIDLGDGKPLAAWVVELDWWGMGAANTAENHSVGGGVNGTAGPGGKYWVLKDPPRGVPAVVRIRTQIDESTDSVIQTQAGK